MRGYLEQKQREHFLHGDDCRCEVSEDPKRDYYHETIDYEALEAAHVAQRISYGEKPHAGRNSAGDTCECDLCIAWEIEQDTEVQS